jgi:hypothetical protein
MPSNENYRSGFKATDLYSDILLQSSFRISTTDTLNTPILVIIACMASWLVCVVSGGYNAPRLRRAKRVRQHAVVGASPLIFVYFTHLTTVT